MSSVGGVGRSELAGGEVPASTRRAIHDAADAGNRLQLMDELRTALTSDQLVLHYQPKIDLPTRDVHGVEALVRWAHPTRGLLYPDAFLHLVEECGLMPTLTRMVLDLALQQVASWQTLRQELTVSVNLSASALADSHLPDEVAAMLATRDLAPGVLQLEVTEQFLVTDRERALDILTRLHDHGVQISVDGSGTGYSSLAHLCGLPVDELRLDRTFISPMAKTARAAALVASTIGLGHSLDLRMVAEGVETNLGYAMLTRLGCDQAQGYFMSKPVSAPELGQWLTTRRAGRIAFGGPQRQPPPRSPNQSQCQPPPRSPNHLQYQPPPRSANQPQHPMQPRASAWKPVVIPLFPTRAEHPQDPSTGGPTPPASPRKEV